MYTIWKSSNYIYDYWHPWCSHNEFMNVYKVSKITIPYHKNSIACWLWTSILNYKPVPLIFGYIKIILSSYRWQDYLFQILACKLGYSQNFSETQYNIQEVIQYVYIHRVYMMELPYHASYLRMLDYSKSYLFSHILDQVVKDI